MRYTFHDWVYIGLFGALWALVDTRIGPWLVTRDVPFFSGVLAALGIMLALIGRRFVPRPGSLVLMACFALLLKFMYAGGFISTPVLRILSPALVAEVTLLAAQRLRPGRAGPIPFVLAGALAVFWTLAQSFLFPAIFAPQGLKMIYALTLIGGARLLHTTALSTSALLALSACAHLLMGGLAGLAAWGLGRIRSPGRAPVAPVVHGVAR
jgi:hypothetical protein